MATTRFRRNPAGFVALRTSARARALIVARAQAIATAAGPDFRARQSPGRNRARATIGPTTIAGVRIVRRDPARLIGALSAGRR